MENTTKQYRVVAEDANEAEMIVISRLGIEDETRVQATLESNFGGEMDEATFVVTVR